MGNLLPILITLIYSLAPMETAITGQFATYGGYNNRVRDRVGVYRKDGILTLSPGLYLNSYSRGNDHLLRYFLFYHLYTSREVDDEFQNELIYTATLRFPPRHTLRWDLSFNQATPNTLMSVTEGGVQQPMMQSKQYYILWLESVLFLESRLTPKFALRPELTLDYWILNFTPEDLKRDHYDVGVNPRVEFGYMVTRRGELLLNLIYTHRFFLSTDTPDYFTIISTLGWHHEFPPWVALRFEAGLLAGKIIEEGRPWEYTLAARAQLAFRIQPAHLEITLDYSRGAGQRDFVTQGGVMDSAALLISFSPLPQDRLIFTVGGSFYRTTDWFTDNPSEPEEALMGFGGEASVIWRFISRNSWNLNFNATYRYFREELGREAQEECTENQSRDCEWLDLHVALAGISVEFDIYGSRLAIESQRESASHAQERLQADILNEPPPPQSVDSEQQQLQQQREEEEEEEGLEQEEIESQDEETSQDTEEEGEGTLPQEEVGRRTE